LKCRLAASGSHAREEKDVKGIVLFGIATTKYAEPPQEETREDEWFPSSGVDIVSREENCYAVSKYECRLIACRNTYMGRILL